MSNVCEPSKYKSVALASFSPRHSTLSLSFSITHLVPAVIPSPFVFISLRSTATRNSDATRI